MSFWSGKLERIARFLQEKKGSLALGGLPLGAAAFILSQVEGRRLICLLPSEAEAQALEKALSFFGAKPVVRLPAPEVSPFAGVYPEIEISGQRVAALYRLLEEKSLFLVTSLPSFMRRTLSPSLLKDSYEYLVVGEEVSREAFLERLLFLGYERTGLVQRLGEFCVRGGVIDVYPPGYEGPLRFDFFGDELEAIRLFDPETQRSRQRLEEAVILPVREILFKELEKIEARLAERLEKRPLPPDKRAAYFQTLEDGHLLDPEEFWLPLVYEEPASLRDYWREDDLLVLFRPEEIQEAVARFEERLVFSWKRAEEGKRVLVEPFESFLAKEEALRDLQRDFRLEIWDLPLAEEGVLNFEAQDHQLHLEAVRAEPKQAIKRGLAYLREHLEAGERVVVVSREERPAERLKALFHRELALLEVPIRKAPFRDLEGQGLEIFVGLLPRGFWAPEWGLLVISEEELFGLRRPLVESRKSPSKDTFLRFEDLKPGDFVVHREHGIGRYQGLVSLELGGLPGEFLLIEYKGGDKLYLPVDRLNLLHRYVGIEGKEPSLDRLGGKSFATRKEKVKKAIEEVAQELLSLYAARKVQQGFSFEPGPLLRQVEATFPYEETPDQAAAIEETLSDMQKPRPMDRLVCGDVGYGKTEVAVRAAALAVENGKQVAVLVPTTVLAEQHYRTFSERLSPLGIRVAVLSRLKSAAEQKKTLKALAAGEIDVVIGTHRLLSADVSFRDLGLLIIDEEHRFGVRHKERLKQLKKNVDVLALSATPIPRTLQLSLLGIRDLSVINTPPQARLPVKTYLARFEPEIIKQAIERELARGGQVFFVHNRIKGIYALADWLKRLVPRARIEVAHGRTPAPLLEEIMVRFVRREIDVLVCTTIIESGLDIPSANTIIINRADRLGLAEIYQLRGRVGRSNVQAYAYLLVPSLSALSEEAEKRLKALMQFSELGSGFKLAMSDLQIRGAGNLLGTFQSGHVAAVGYDLYLEILKRTIDEMRGREPEEMIEPEVNLKIPAYIPEAYVPDTEQRLHLYRKLAMSRSLEEIEAFGEELEDRFGPPPEEAKNLLVLAQLKVHLRALGVRKLDRRGREAIFFFDPSREIPAQAARKVAQKNGFQVRVTKDQKLFLSIAGEDFLSELLSFATALEERLKGAYD